MAQQRGPNPDAQVTQGPPAGQQAQRQPQPAADVDARVTALRTQVEQNAVEATRRQALADTRISRHEGDHTRHPGQHEFTLGELTPSGAQIAGIVILGVVVAGILYLLANQLSRANLYYVMFALLGAQTAGMVYMFIGRQMIEKEIRRLSNIHRPPTQGTH